MTSACFVQGIICDELRVTFVKRQPLVAGVKVLLAGLKSRHSPILVLTITMCPTLCCCVSLTHDRGVYLGAFDVPVQVPTLSNIKVCALKEKGTLQRPLALSLSLSLPVVTAAGMLGCADGGSLVSPFPCPPRILRLKSTYL
jgi:hypothetical protein